MATFASKLITAVFKKASARPAATRRRRAALCLEPLELRAVLSTVAPIGEPLPDPLPVVHLEIDVIHGGDVAESLDDIDESDVDSGHVPSHS